MGPRGTAQNDRSLKCFISAPPLETPWRCASKPHRAVPQNPCAAPSKPHSAVPRNPRCAAPQNPWGQNLRPKFETKIFKFRWFLGFSDQNELYHTQSQTAPPLPMIKKCLSVWRSEYYSITLKNQGGPIQANWGGEV